VSEKEIKEPVNAPSLISGGLYLVCVGLFFLGGVFVHDRSLSGYLPILTIAMIICFLASVGSAIWARFFCDAERWRWVSGIVLLLTLLQVGFLILKVFRS